MRPACQTYVLLELFLFSNTTLEFEEPEEPNSRSFFSEIIGTISDVKFSHSGRYFLSRDYLTVKVWDLHMESRPIMSMQVKGTKTRRKVKISRFIRIWRQNCAICTKTTASSTNLNAAGVAPTRELIYLIFFINFYFSAIMTGSYNNFFRIFDLDKKDVTFEASKEWIKPRVGLKPKKVWKLINSFFNSKIGFHGTAQEKGRSFSRPTRFPQQSSSLGLASER